MRLSGDTSEDERERIMKVFLALKKSFPASRNDDEGCMEPTKRDSPVTKNPFQFNVHERVELKKMLYGTYILSWS